MGNKKWVNFQDLKCLNKYAAIKKQILEEITQLNRKFK